MNSGQAWSEGLTYRVGWWSSPFAPPPAMNQSLPMKEQLVIPGLDHSLIKKEGGLFVWKQTKGFVHPKPRKKAKSVNSKYWKNKEQLKKQKTLF